ncbi:pfs domain containing protein [Fusarium agapanthi]|uniref:Pfs domain containing protein n=1 Tax=Fusarium agapanthi TaxID=1803897 RepID=A0A9P5EGP8_9HYPO|nr:pfs domain containing protein [Fusarium agapanthi]
MTASKVMLDDIHEALPTSREDTNTYTLGNMGTHNIVIACLPLGRYGLTSAATVANNMRRTFTSMRFGLMVSVGGGVPGKVDVRLGDVVVSKEVAQYDFGKRTGDGQLRPVESLNKPPHVLATAVAKLQADHRTEPSRIPSILANVLVRYPAMINSTCSSALQDRSFNAMYDHIEPSSQPVNPKVDSANQVIKHGRKRNQLAKELDPICFEMEAAGLMDNFPCLVIRGVCDYADSHKNKQWQSYAAMTAAAYAKELLSVISTHRINQKSKPTSSVGVDPVLQERRKTLLESLEVKEIHSRRLGVEVAHEETCEWLLEDPVYQRWLDRSKLIQHHGFLWIKGKPGAGKSTIMKFASLMYILAKNDFTSIMGTAFRLGFASNIHREHLEKPLFAALANGHRGAVKELLQQEMGASQAEEIFAQLVYGKYFSRGDIPLATILLASKQIIPVVSSSDERTPLSLAAENGHESIVRLLLAIETVQLDPKDYMGRTPFSLAALEGHERIVRLLLSTGNVNVNAKDYSGLSGRKNKLSHLTFSTLLPLKREREKENPAEWEDTTAFTSWFEKTVSTWVEDLPEDQEACIKALADILDDDYAIDLDDEAGWERQDIRVGKYIDSLGPIPEDDQGLQQLHLLEDWACYEYS